MTESRLRADCYSPYSPTGVTDSPTVCAIWLAALPPPASTACLELDG
ncbi:MAG: hypothetical protein LC808_13595 [Actinobacteria bacterium]|nr:hypothetical protein [Actinomycetota bacterium]